MPELGFAWIGPADLSVSLGHPLEYNHPAVTDAIETFRSAAIDHGIPIGIDAGNAGGVKQAVETGYQIISTGSEVGAARTVLGESLATGNAATS